MRSDATDEAAGSSSSAAAEHGAVKAEKPSGGAAAKKKLQGAIKKVVAQNLEQQPAPAETAAPAVPAAVEPAAAAKSVAAGRGLHTAIVKQSAQFLITAFDADGHRRESGGDAFVVDVRGVRPPSHLRVKLHDHGNGAYTAEYRPEVSGQLLVTVTLGQEHAHIPGSPFTVAAVTLRPEPSRCVLRGMALSYAVARKPMSFDIDFVDALGHVAYAEELDVRVERQQLPKLPSPKEGRAAKASAASAKAANDGAGASRAEDAAAAGGDVAADAVGSSSSADLDAASSADVAASPSPAVAPADVASDDASAASAEGAAAAEEGGGVGDAPGAAKAAAGEGDSAHKAGGAAAAKPKKKGKGKEGNAEAAAAKAEAARAEAEAARAEAAMLADEALTAEELDPTEPAGKRMLSEGGAIVVTVKRASNIVGADLDGKSDPYVRVWNGERERTSKVVTKTVNPVWNDELVFEGSTLAGYIAGRLTLKLFDCDNPAKMDKDELLGECSVSLGALRVGDAAEFTEQLNYKGRQKGAVSFAVAFRPPPPSAAEQQAAGYAEGEERVVVGKPLILRESVKLGSRECGKVGAGARVRIAETEGTEDGLRCKVLVMQGAVVRNVGWLTALKNGKERLAKVHRKVDVDERRQQYELWNRRLAADRAQQAAVQAIINRAEATTTQKAPIGGGAPKRPAGGGGGGGGGGAGSADAGSPGMGGSSEEALSTVGPSFAHEISDCARGIAFAHGGLFPGTLHAHGELVKTHQVSYSIGAAGKYLLYVGLRQKAMTLPGSPFLIDVKPGAAHAPSTHMPSECLPLRSVVGTQGSLLIRLSDSMGNVCVEGGAPVKSWVDTESIQTAVEDKDDGSYLIAWKGQTSGTHRMSVTIDGVHILGSPAPITLTAAAPDVTRCDLLGAGVHHATAGEPARLEVRCRDAYGNDALPTPRLSYGLVLLQLPSSEKHGKGGATKAGKAGGVKHKESESDADAHAAAAELQASYNMPEMKRAPAKLSQAERLNLAKTLPSIDFDGRWEGSSYHLTYVPHEAGDFELHAWSDPDGSGTRLFFPGVPFPLHVGPGKASASGSFLRDGAISTLVAGERLVLHVQLRDEWGNASNLTLEDGHASAALTATLETPDGDTQPLTLKASGAANAPAGSSKDVTGGGGGSSSADGGEGGGGGGGGGGSSSGPPGKPAAPNAGGGKKVHASAAAHTGAAGVYEIVSPADLTAKGNHVALIMLHGQPIHGSPIRFRVVPGAPVAAKSRLVVNGKVLSTQAPIEVVLQLVDKFGNVTDKGDVRVDAKAFGPKASECAVVDCQNGTYTITFTASAVGDYKLQVRLENVDMAPLPVHVVAGEGVAAGDAPGSKPPTPKDAAGAPAPTAAAVAAAAKAKSAVPASPAAKPGRTPPPVVDAAPPLPAVEEELPASVLHPPPAPGKPPLAPAVSTAVATAPRGAARPSQEGPSPASPPPASPPPASPPPASQPSGKASGDGSGGSGSGGGSGGGGVGAPAPLPLPLPTTAEANDADDEELRIDASDGGAFRRDEFVEYYGGTDEWDAAIRLGTEAAKPYEAAWAAEEAAEATAAESSAANVPETAAVATTDAGTKKTPKPKPKPGGKKGGGKKEGKSGGKKDGGKAKGGKAKDGKAPAKKPAASSAKKPKHKPSAA